MSSRLLAFGFGLVLTVGALVFLKSQKAAVPIPAPSAQAPPREPRQSIPTAPKREPQGVASTLTISEEISNEIEAAVVTYSPDALPTFEKFLASGEPDVREAARDGLLRLGEKGGAALLRRATARMTDPEEIKRFREAADFLELPSALEGPLKNGIPKP